MTVLLVDAGNTRIKWVRVADGRMGRRHAAAHAGLSAAGYARRLFGRRVPERMLVSSVAGARVNRPLAAAARRAGVKVQFVRVPKRGGGVTVGYRDPWRLGVDRFVAAVGAVDLLKGTSVCVVGVGTAMTIDLIDMGGRHRGGVIIPAPTLLVQTLLARTHGIRSRAQGGAQGGGSLFGRSTRAAVVQGARHAAAATIDQAVEQARPLVGRAPLVVLTGGGAPAVRGLLRSHWVLVPDLVLRGLAVVRGSAAPKRRRT